MTMEPVAPSQSFSDFETKVSDRYSTILEDLFLLGYATSEPYVVYKDGDTEIVVQYRTLTPSEIRNIDTIANRFESTIARGITEQMEILARAIVSINDMPLLVNSDERMKLSKELGREPNTLDQARYILTEKIRSEHVLNILYDQYQEFADSIEARFDEVKKKLNKVKSSKST